MKARAAWLALWALGGCYDPTFPVAAFSCDDGACPSGYRCTQQLCIADDATEPPLLVGTTTIDAPPPRPVWDGSGFAVVWQKEAADDAGLHIAQVGTTALTDLAVTTISGVRFDAVAFPSTGRYLFSITANGTGASESNARLDVRSVARDGTDARLHFTRDEMNPAIGFSAPSLAKLTSTTGVRLAYTYAAPPTVVADNVFCLSMDLVGGTPDESCRPSTNQTMGSYASAAIVAVTSQSTTIFWQGRVIHVAAQLAGVEQPPTTLDDTVAVGEAVDAEPDVVFSGQQLVGSELVWSVARRGASSAASAIAGRAEPGIAVASARVLVCSVDETGALSVTVRATSDLQESGRPLAIARYSQAAIESCRIAVADDGAHALVAWKELVPPSAAQIYATTVTLP